MKTKRTNKPKTASVSQKQNATTPTGRTTPAQPARVAVRRPVSEIDPAIAAAWHAAGTRQLALEWARSGKPRSVWLAIEAARGVRR